MLLFFAIIIVPETFGFVHKKRAAILCCSLFRDPPGARTGPGDRALVYSLCSTGFELVTFGFVHKKRAAILCCSLFRDPPGARTQDPNIKSVVLYLLS